MKMKYIIGERFKEKPADCIVDSHALMIKGGYIKAVASGIYSFYTPGKRISDKISKIIREEMEMIEGQEVLLPVVMPGSLWQESGRLDSVGEELVRFHDRNKNTMVLGMTHEEAAVQLVRDYANSYTKYPFMIYQIQTKFRDEARARAGLIRTREFLMKDAYSFHTSKEDMEQYYQQCHRSYERIFARVGVPEVVSVAADSGMMGGSVSHEFMLLTAIGEDSIVVCDSCDYKANIEVAKGLVTTNNTYTLAEMTKVHTSSVSSIEDIVKFLNISIENTCKAVVYQKNTSNDYVIVFIRGDLDVNETKVMNVLKEEIRPAEITNESNLHTGFIGPYQLDTSHTVLFDHSLKGIQYLSCGANEEDYHYIGFNIARDYGEVEYYDFMKIKDGDICPNCGKLTMRIKRGIEVGNIFQLGTKYTETMKMQYVDSQGTLQYPIMGCYGIGIGRLMASIVEVSHDDYGPIWPITIAPWQVHVCCIRADDMTCNTYANTLYQELLEKGIEVIIDDRDLRTGAMFSDADLLGVPIRVIVSPRNLKEQVVEVVTRDKSSNEKVKIGMEITYIETLIESLTKSINNVVPKRK
jgi:prolyl-tRNA synthetase